MAGGAWTTDTVVGSSPLGRKHGGFVYDRATSLPLMFGGTDGIFLFGDTWTYNPVTNGWWNRAPSAAPSARCDFGMVLAGSYTYLFGGNVTGFLAAHPIVSAELWRWNGTVWSLLSPSGPTPAGRWGCTLTQGPSPDDLVLFGGCSSGAFDTSVWVYSISTNTWTEHTSVGPTGRVRHVAFWDHTKDSLFISGGMTDLVAATSSSYFTDTWEWHSTIGWTRRYPSNALVGQAPGAGGVAWDYNTKSVIVPPSNAAVTPQTPTWGYQEVGALWYDLEPTNELEARTGRMVAFDQASGASRGCAFAFGGEDSTGAFDANTYRFTWSSLGVAPYVVSPGATSGRLAPKFYPDVDADGYVYVFGSDEAELPVYMLNIGDTMQIEQQFSWPADARAIRFVVRMRYHKDMPRLREISVPAGEASFINTGKLIFNDAADATQGLRLASPEFTVEDQDQLLVISGATDAANNSFAVTPHRIAAVPSDQGQIGALGDNDGTYRAGTTLVLEAPGGAVTQRDPEPNALTLKRLGARWRFKLSVNTGTGFDDLANFSEQEVSLDPEGVTRYTLAAHLSKVPVGTTVTVRCETYLEYVAS